MPNVHVHTLRPIMIAMVGRQRRWFRRCGLFDKYQERPAKKNCVIIVVIILSFLESEISKFYLYF